MITLQQWQTCCNPPLEATNWNNYKTHTKLSPAGRAHLHVKWGPGFKKCQNLTCSCQKKTSLCMQACSCVNTSTHLSSGHVNFSHSHILVTRGDIFFFCWIHAMTQIFAVMHLCTGQEVKVTILASRTLYSPEQRGEELQWQPLILFNLFSDGALEYQPAP